MDLAVVATADTSVIHLSSACVEAPDPIGAVCLAWTGETLLALDFGAASDRLLRLLRRRFGPGLALADGDPGLFGDAVRAYFEGDLSAFDQLRHDGGGTPFQRLVWSALRSIPPGETRSYGQIARAIGQPTASRAVGLANGSNPISLAVPCHRVVGSQGALTGYGGGLERKRWLLAHEGITTRSLFQSEVVDPSAPLRAREPQPA